MNIMTKRYKAYLIRATVFALVNTLFLIIINRVGSDLILAWSFPRGGESPLPWPFIVLVIWELINILWICGLISFYIMNIVKANCITRKQKVMWTVLILLVHILVMPVYWYLYVRIEPDTLT